MHSRYFDSMFKHSFLESKPEDDGKYYIEAEEFHPEVMMHVMNVIHAQNKKVPCQLTLEMLTHLAVITDALFLWL
jgi:hypothetical protein